MLNDSGISWVSSLYVFSSLLSLYISDFLKGNYLKRKEFAPKWEHIRCYRVDPIQEGDKMILTKLKRAHRKRAARTGYLYVQQLSHTGHLSINKRTLGTGCLLSLLL